MNYFNDGKQGRKNKESATSTVNFLEISNTLFHIFVV